MAGLFRTLFFYWRTHLAVALGAAVATAVLAGALVVGDSVRGSLRDITLERLGRVDAALVVDRFVDSDLAERLVAAASNDKQRVLFALRRVWSREPSAEELEEALAYIAQYKSQWKRDVQAAAGTKAKLVLEYRFDGNANDTSGGDRQ